MRSIDIIKQLNRCDYFLILWVIYYLQGIIYPEGGLISVSILAVNLLISAYYAIKVIDLPDKPVYFKGLACLLIMFSIYGFLLIITNGTTFHYGIGGSMPSYNYIKTIYLSFLPIFPFYYFTITGYLTEQRLKKWAVIFFLSCTLLFFRTQREVVSALLNKRIQVEGITNNAGYMFLSLIPVMFLFRRRPIVMLIGIAYIMAFVVMGMKRGAILIGVVAALYYLHRILKMASSEEKFKLILLSIAVIVCMVLIAMYQMKTSEYAVQRIAETKEGNSSNRDLIYSYYWNYFTYEADIIHFIVGRGANGTMELIGFAHNDWLEIAVNQGSMGIIIYSIYWFCFYMSCKSSINLLSRDVMFSIFIIFIIKTLFSMSYEEMNYISTSMLGYSLAICNEEENLLLYEQG